MTNEAKDTPKVAALKFLNAATRGGWTVRINGTVVTISKTFTPGDRDAFVECDMDYDDILSKLPARGGSTWGTDGGGVGGAIALQSGEFVMKMSGVSKVAARTLESLL